jgi:hypothetical protein
VFRASTVTRFSEAILWTSLRLYKNSRKFTEKGEVQTDAHITIKVHWDDLEQTYYAYYTTTALRILKLEWLNWLDEHEKGHYIVYDEDSRNWIYTGRSEA